MVETKEATVEEDKGREVVVLNDLYRKLRRESEVVEEANRNIGKQLKKSPVSLSSYKNSPLLIALPSVKSF